jgi:A/G-specific adenine glycosylase
MKNASFILLVWKFYEKHGRHTLPWRNTDNPYHILVSEVMLQQTQSDRVIPKYLSFIVQFPTIESLASASQESVLREWKGLGYNRRALNLWRASQIISSEFGGIVPIETEKLTSLPGIGPYSAAAVQAFAFNQPSIVIETNIRTVFIKHFFPKVAEKIQDNTSSP